MANPFDGVRWPQLIVSAELAGAAPSSTTIVIGVGPGLGTGTLGGGTYAPITTDSTGRNTVRSITWNRGRDSEVDPANPGVCTIVFGNQSGDLDPTNTASPHYPNIDVGLPVRVQALLDGVLYDRFSGELVDIEMDAGTDPTVTFTIADGLERLSRARLTPIEATFDGDATGTRIGHILDTAGWATALRDLDTGITTLGPTTFGDTALELIRKVERTEFGLVFCDGANNVVFYDRYRPTSATRSTVVQAAFTDQGGASDLGMMELSVARSRERTYNDWHILRDATTDDDEPVEQVATDTASVDSYGTLSGPSGFGELNPTDEDALNMASGLLDLLGTTPQDRVREVRLNALRGDLWATFLPLTLLDRISVRRDYGPVTVGPVELLIQAMREDITVDPVGWTITFTTTNTLTAPSLFLIGTGEMGDTLGGW